ncbi:molybdate ABC transporter substrate-binding protein [Salidesulfovibrio onnuriiensis]|uniref:molybdate ABC transporter substrate-binding protein n=1 Tax=Salidesulfovibrio onnuriiensis TaxID=2583823 RepID=UPI0011CAD859|nr:molybdate ABC transporter substrate-binding protein [Salidesulfovibrio onnuriiensis]
MRLIRIAVAVCVLLLGASGLAQADNLVLASGAGYKKMVNELVAVYEQRTGQTIDRLYGNMGRVVALSKESGRVDIALGAEDFLRSGGLEFRSTHMLGKGRLVLAYPKGSSCSSVATLDDPAVKRIALPDTSKAIYGRAAREFLTSTGRLPDIKPRLVEVATVPQVFSYLVAHEVDMGFLNLTHALHVQDKLGGYVLVPEKDYEPISIVAGELQGGGKHEQVLEFFRFLATPEAKAIISRSGL